VSIPGLLKTWADAMAAEQRDADSDSNDSSDDYKHKGDSSDDDDDDPSLVDYDEEHGKILEYPKRQKCADDSVRIKCCNNWNQY
jgi:hypothetical protein